MKPLLVLLVLAAVPFFAGAEALNVDATRKKIQVEPLLVLDQQNIVCFYTASDSICRALYPELVKIGNQPNTTIHMLDIGNSGSPTAKQYSIVSVPYFQIYDKKGQLVSEGAPAYKAVTKMIGRK